MTPVKVILKGIAHRDFDKIHHFLENRRLTITLRNTTFPEEVLKKERALEEEDFMTLLHIVGSSETELQQLVSTAVANVNLHLNGEFAFVI